MAGYTRNDTSNNIATGNVINAADLDGEFDALVAAFHASTGHTHDGTAANGAPITKIGPVQDLVISTGAITPKTDNTVDLGSSSFEFKDLYIDGTANIDALVADTADINAGTIDGVVIGGSTTAAGSFTTLTTSSTVTLNGGTANGVLYLNGSKVATSGSSLQFNGTNFYTTAQIIGGAGSANANIIASSTVTNGGAGFSQFLFGNASTDTRGYLSYSHAAEAILFGTSGTEQMRLTSTGLGIGTSSPNIGTWNRALTLNTASGNAAYEIGVGGVAQAYLAADSSNVYFQVANTTSPLRVFTGGAERLRLDSSGNLGLGVTPSAWGSGYRTLQISSSASFQGNTGVSAFVGNNCYNDGTNWKYITSAASVGTQLFGLNPNGSGGFAWSQAASGTAGNTISFTQAMTLDASGNLGIGATSVQGGMNLEKSSSANTVAAAASIILSNRNGGSGTFLAGGIFSNTYRDITTSQYTAGVWFEKQNSGAAGTAASQGAIVFGANDYTNAGDIPIERARITSGGYFKASNSGTYVSSTGLYHELVSNDASNGVGVIESTNASYSSYVLTPVAARNTTNNSFYAIGYFNRGAGAYKFLVADSGDVTNTNGTYGTISDAKMKTDIVDAGSQWSDIKAIRFRKFKMKNDPNGLVQLGVVAQELEQTSPGLVDEHVDRDAEGNDLGTTTKSVKTSILLMKAAKALQEAMARIETLEAKVSALEGN